MESIKVFSSDEVARLLGISTISRWRERKAGRISFRRIASRIVFTEADILEFLEQNKNAAISIRTGAPPSGLSDDSGAGHCDRGQRQSDR